MKLKVIPANTIVHTPTEAEAKELLAILHENGYAWYAAQAKEDGWNDFKNETCYRINSHDNVYHTCDREWYETTCKYCRLPILTLAEFKERYCEEEKPRFSKGDKVIYVGDENSYYKGRKFEIDGEIFYNDYFECLMARSIYNGIIYIGNVPLTDLKPYTEPETKEETKDEAKEAKDDTKGNNSENSRLNLCELLIGHEGEEFYSLIAGKCRLKEINEGAGFPICIILDACTTWEYLTKDGKRFNVSDARCMLFPSRALYEQYPLDPYTAWLKWMEEQKKFGLDIKIETYFEGKYGWEDCFDDVSCLHFHTPADRDKCIEEIKAIIEKYSKK